MPYGIKAKVSRISWNPVTGCFKFSEGCKNCYAERLARHLQELGVEKYRNGFKLTLHPEVLEYPLKKWRKPSIIFVVSMGDLFAEAVPEDFIAKVFDVMNRAHWHIFQLLTKRSWRLAKLAPRLRWTENIWVGVTVELKKYYFRIDQLRQVPAKVRFLSLEPLLGPMPNLPLEGIDWVVVGGESGPRARPMKKQWVLDIKRQCESAGVAFYFKQWGGDSPDRGGDLLDGKRYHQFPPQIRFLLGNTLFDQEGLFEEGLWDDPARSEG